LYREGLVGVTDPTGFGSAENIKMRRVSLPLVLLVALQASCWRFTQPTFTDAPQAHKIFADALEQAQLAEKPVFILFTQNEFWCHQLEAYHADEDVARLVDKYFIVVTLPIDALVGAQQMYVERGGERGVPAYTIVDSHDELLADSGDVGQNIGFPNNDEEVQRYLDLLKIACPKMTDEEQTLLRNKLEARRITDVITN
jgi:hypothetical protein